MSKPVSLSRRALHRLFLRPNKRQRLRHLARLRLIEQLEMRALLTGVTLIDLNQTPAGSDPSAVVVVGDQGFFSAGDGTHGRELWRTDGTEAGTVLVKDIQPGPSGSLSQSGFSQSVDVSGTLFFVADELTHGQELWKSDGTEAGTVLVKDIYPGRESSSIQALTASNGRLYFLANDGVHGNELWTSDGTEAGTVLVKDIHPSGGQEFDSDGGSIVSFGDGVLFGASDGVRGRELWRSDGTEEGTSMVIGLLPIETDPSQVVDGFRDELVVFGSQAYFLGYTKATGGKLYRTDGTEAGTQPFGGETILRSSSMVELAGTLYFFGYDGLYQSDGSSTDTVSRISDLPESIENITLVGNRVFFSAHDDQFGEQLWTSDGTEAGTLRVTEIDRGLDFRGEPMGAAILSIHDFGGVAFVVLNDGIHGGELWRSDGTEAGTRIVKDINPGQLSNDLYDEGVVLGGQFIFPADNGTGGELWRTDGTEAGTTMIKEIDTVSTQPSNPRNSINLPGSLFISADDGIHGYELIKTDGTRSGTSLLKDIHPDGDSSPSNMTLLGDTVFFSAEDPTHGRELWKTDGTEAGTVLVVDLVPGPEGSTPIGFAQIGGKLLFSAGNFSKYSSINSVELYRLGVDPAMVTATMTDTLSVDVNNDGKVNPGDTLKYTTTLSVGSEADADGVLYTQTIDANSTIVPGSVSTSQGTVFTGSNGGNSLNIGLGTIPAGSVVSIAYSVRVRDPLSANVTQISNQGTFSGDNFSNLLTDDPSQAGASDPTTTPIDTGTAAGIAPVATDFPLPAIPLGSVLHIDATDMIAEFGTDADSLLNAMSVSFGSATINGTPVASLAELGFSYTPGAGPAGAFTIDANASAYAGLAAGFAHDVIINFTVSDGALQDSGVLTFKVANAAAKFKDVAFHFLGATSPESQVKAIADAAAGESVFVVVASGTGDVSDALDHANFFVGGFDTSKVAGQMLTVAQAAATNASLATAAAENESIAVAIADDQSDSTAVASNHSVASAESQGGSGSTSAADDNSAASSRAVNNSDALALAEEGSAAEASAENESSATATAKAISNATSTSSQNSVSVSSAETTSSATAFASQDSVSTADALRQSIADAVAIHSAAAASAANGSDALAFAQADSAATANSDGGSSASAAADMSSRADATATDASTANTSASNGSKAATLANMNSVASSLAINNTILVSATARDNSAARAAGVDQSQADATATGRSAADAAANAANTGGVSSGIETGNEIADELQGKIAAITSEATIAKVFIADLALSAIMGIAGQSLADFINDLVGRESDAEPITASTATANAESGSVALAFAEEGSAADASAGQGSSAGASAEGTSNSTALAKSGLDAFAKADHQSTADANAASDSVEAFTINATSASQIATSTPSEPFTLQRGGSIILPFAINGAGIESLASVVISGLPAGSQLTSGTPNANGTEWTFTSLPSSELILTPPATFVGNINASLTATTTTANHAAAAARVVVTSETGSVLNRETVNVTKTAEVVSQETNLNIPGVPASVLNGVELNNADAIRAALVASGVNADSINIAVKRRDNGQTVTAESKNSVTESPDAIWTGTVDDPDNIVVITGTVTVTTTITTTTTKMFTDVLTITGELVMQQPTADLSLVVTVDNGSAEVGQNVTFTIVLNNAGPDAATGVTVLDKLPVGLQFVQANTASGSYSSESGVWTVGGLPVGGTSSLTIVAKLLTDQTINNLAEIASSDQFDPDSTPNNGVVGEDDQFSASVGTCLTGGPLVAGMNRLVFSCVTPGGFAAFVVGTQPGSYTFSKWGTTVDMADPSVPAIGAAGSNGVAVVLINLTPAQLAQPLYVQAFEMLPAHG
ncbi:MAG: hypothetical protein R3C09_18565 [Pirellulaceae bacterium]